MKTRTTAAITVTKALITLKSDDDGNRNDDNDRKDGKKQTKTPKTKTGNQRQKPKRPYEMLRIIEKGGRGNRKQ